jgi:PTS system, fructose subfamily, IIC component
MDKLKSTLKEMQKAFLSGVSFMIPAVVAGGILLAISLSTGTKTAKGIVITNEFMKNLNTLGAAGMAMMIPILAGYIAYSIAGKPGLAPGVIMGYIANNPIGTNATTKTGFLGAMIVGVAVGYLVKWIKGWNVPKPIKAIMPILVIPTITVIVVGLAYIYLIAGPVSGFMALVTKFLGNLNGTNKVLLAICIGFMNAFDMGGPVTKTVSMFTLALMNEGIFGPNGMFRITVAIPPIGIFLATVLFKKKFDQGEKDLAKAAGIMGCMGITEGAIPFAVNDVKRVLPSTMIGAAVGAVIGALCNVQSPVPHGGFITLPVVTNKIPFTIAIIVGSLVTAIMLGILKPDKEQFTESDSTK